MLSDADFEPGVAQIWAQFFVSEKSDEANLLKRSGEPPRTRTWNPLIKSLETTADSEENKRFSPAKQEQVRQNVQPIRNPNSEKGSD
jgi:hypothetical protein